MTILKLALNCIDTLVFIGISMGTPLALDLFFLNFKRDSKLFISDSKQADVIDAFSLIPDIYMTYSILTILIVNNCQVGYIQLNFS